MHTWSIAAGIFVLATSTACTGVDEPVPTAPSRATQPQPSGSISLPPEAGIGTGTVVIRELDPGVGATLAVQSECLNGRVTVLCTDGWRGTFDVLVDRDMTNAVLTARFYDGNRFCAYAASTLDLVPAGSRVSLTMSRIHLSDHSGKLLDCPLPATTNRIEVELWSDYSGWTNTLIHRFANTYTFYEPAASRP